MRTSELFLQNTTYPIIQERCSTFITESKKNPLFKNLPRTYLNCHKSKVRKQKHQEYLTTTFNEAFDDRTHNIRQRAIFTKGNLLEQHNDTEPFYVFPIDGYKFLYSKEVSDSSNAYKQVFESLIKQFGNVSGNEMLTDVLRFSYTCDNLAEGITSGSEIILYNIPFYYAIRVSSVPSYHSLF